MSPEATEKRREYYRNYMRKWRAENKEKERLYESRKWENAAKNDTSNKKECRCSKCGKLFFKARLADLEIQCSRCKTMNTVEVLEAL